MDAALATEIFLVESKLQHRDKILPLLLNLLKCLPYAKLNEQRESNNKTKACLAEEFSFHFALLLMEVATLEKEQSIADYKDIVSAVIDVFQVLVNDCISVEKQSSTQKGEFRLHTLMVGMTCKL